MKPFDVFLVAAPKDYSKIEFCIGAIVEHIKGYENIFLCTPKPLPQEIVKTLHYPIHYRTDLAVLQATPRLWKYRPNWVYQQFIKLFQNETINDWYLVVDIDTIINKPLPLWDEKRIRPIWYVGWEQNNRPYYAFTNAMMGFGRVYNHTFLADMGFYSKTIVREMLKKFQYTPATFLRKSYKVISEVCYPSEADLYMGYCTKFLVDYYEIRHLHTKLDAREGTNPLVQLWDRDEIQSHIAQHKGGQYDTFSMHSWVNKSHNDWSI